MNDVEKHFGLERQYTKWLEQNLSPIEQIIEDHIINTTCEETSSNVNGITKFRVDIKGYLASDSTPILIEAQYGLTDHRHLGQLLTYAAHHNAKKLVWIAEGIRIEHLRAVEFINKLSSQAKQTFHIYLLAVQVSDEGVPHYVVADESVVQESKIPNEYKQDASEKRYWEEFSEYYLPAIPRLQFTPGSIKSDYSEIRFGTHYYFNLAIRQGYTQFKIDLICNKSKKGQILLDNLLSDKAYIIQQLNTNLNGLNEISVHDRNITITFNADIYNYAKWENYMKLMKTSIICLYNLITDEKYNV